MRKNLPVFSHRGLGKADPALRAGQGPLLSFPLMNLESM